MPEASGFGSRCEMRWSCASTMRSATKDIDSCGPSPTCGDAKAMKLKHHRWSKLLPMAVLLGALPLQAQKFYPDDPLTQEPAPFPVDAANFRGLNPLYETVMHQFGKPGERHPANGVIPALSANTLGEVMDGPWFVESPCPPATLSHRNCWRVRPKASRRPSSRSGAC